ncbi:MAG: hypothetical protein PVG99_05050 [Desulfobacteraceae bacterium]|jgi:hypothetical protein
MDISSGDISALVFRRVIREEEGEFAVDSRMLSVLMELDGQKSLALIARKIGLDMGAIRQVTAKLLKLKLVEPVEGAVSVLDRDFLDFLSTQLRLAVGPIGEVLIEDAMVDLGNDLNQFPSHRAAELVDLLARQIQREEKRTEFQQSMISKIKEKGY